MNKTLKVLSVVVVVVVAYFLLINQSKNIGSVSITHEYLATSTAASNVYGAWTNGTLVRSGVTTFGSVIITGANTGIVNIYDATTTSILKRAPSKATSTILIASFPASTAAGTYTFDIQLKDGLYVDLVSGLMPTTTITYRR